MTKNARTWHPLGSAAALVIGSIGVAEPLGAQPLERRRSDAYYVTHSALTAAGLTGGVLLTCCAGGQPPPSLLPPTSEDLTRLGVLGAAAAGASDRSLLTTMLIPPAAQLSDGFDRRFANAALIYGEAHAVNLLLTSLVKVMVARPRPYVSSELPAARALALSAGADAYRSFFSGHASSAYTSAFAGSLLYAARTDELVARHVMWGFEVALAATTAQLRVRSSRHHRSDIWVGSLVGIGIGLGVPAAHGVPLSRVRASEWGTAAGAALVTIGLWEWLAPETAIDREGAARRNAGGPGSRRATPGGTSGRSPEADAAPRVRWSLLPFAHGPGVTFAVEL